MRTNIDIDDKLIKEGLKYARVKTKKELVHIALHEYIELHKRKNLIELKGKISFLDDYDHKSMRKGS